MFEGNFIVALFRLAVTLAGINRIRITSRVSVLHAGKSVPLAMPSDKMEGFVVHSNDFFDPQFLLQ